MSTDPSASVLILILIKAYVRDKSINARCIYILSAKNLEFSKLFLILKKSEISYGILLVPGKFFQKTFSNPTIGQVSN